MLNIFSKKTNKNLSIIISLDDQDNIDIKYTYNPSETNNQHRMSTLLYAINNGLLTSHFIQYLLKEKNIIFSSSVIDKWNSYNISNTKLSDNEPIINPINAFSKNAK